VEGAMKNITIGLDSKTFFLIKLANPKNVSKFIREAIAEKAQAELDAQIEGYCENLKENMEDFDGFNKESEENWPN